MLIIDHRLSTVTHANQILVLSKGKLHERGTHEELLERDGHHATMWKKQIRAQGAAEHAKVFEDTAEYLHRQSEDVSISDDDSDNRYSPEEDKVER